MEGLLLTWRTVVRAYEKKQVVCYDRWKQLGYLNNTVNLADAHPFGKCQIPDEEWGGGGQGVRSISPHTVTQVDCCDSTVYLSQKTRCYF